MIKYLQKSNINVYFLKGNSFKRHLTLLSDRNRSRHEPSPGITNTLISSFLNKHDIEPDETNQITPISDIKPSASQIKFTKVNKDGSHSVDHRQIILAFASYQQTGNIEAAMDLCNRLTEYKIFPHPKALASLIEILQVLDSHMVHEIYLNILRSMHKEGMTPANSLFGLLTGKIRYFKDPFLRMAFKSEVEEYIEEYPQYTHFLPILNRDYAISLLNDGDIEATYTMLSTLPEKEKAKFPINRFLHLLSNLDGLDQCLMFCESAPDEIDPSNWLLALQRSIYEKKGRAVELLWDLYFKDHRMDIPDYNKSDIIACAGSRQRLDIIQGVLGSFNGKNLSPRDAENIINTCSNESNWVDIDTCLENCIKVMFYQPNIDVKVMDRFLKFIARISIVPDKFGSMMEDAFDKVQAEIQRTKYAVPTVDQVQTVVMNCTLKSQAFIAGEPYYAMISFMGFLKKKFPANSLTLELLAAIARRLGDSKKLIYVIYKYLVDKCGIKPTKNTLLYIIDTQMTGNSYSSAMYFILEMQRKGLKLDETDQTFIENSFKENNDDSYENYLAAGKKRLKRLQQKYSTFPKDSALLTHGDAQTNDKPNSYSPNNDLELTDKLLDVLIRL